MRVRRAMLLASLLGLLSACSGDDEPDDAAGTALADRGRPTEVAPAIRQELDRRAADGGKVFILGELAGRRFYRIAAERGGSCFAVGDRTRLDAVECPGGGFPSAQQPVLDLSLVELATPDTARVVRLEGLAGAGVDTIRLVNASGATLIATQVVDNLYAVPVVPDRPVAALVARDAAGREVGRISYVGP